MNNQLTELLTNYGKIGAIWFDGWWDQDQNPDFDWQLPGQYAMIHSLQPACLGWEQPSSSTVCRRGHPDIRARPAGENRAGLSGQDISALPLETCETMNGMWGYKITDQDYKSTKTLIHYLVKAAGKDANLLMNIGPQPDGELPAVALERLAEVGEWMKVTVKPSTEPVAAALLRILGESLHKEKINYTCIFSNCRIRLSSCCWKARK